MIRIGPYLRPQNKLLRIAVNTRFLLKGKLEGFGWYTYETLKRITVQHPEHEFIFLFDRPYDERFIFSDNITPVVIGPPARHPILFYLWFERSVRKALKKYQADVFVSPDGYLCTKTDLPQLAVIHDVSFEHYPEDIPPSPRRYLKKWFPRFARKADRIVTVSEFSKQDIIKQYGVKAEKIDAVWNGAADLFHPISDEDKQATRQKLTGGVPYFIYIGALHARKNVSRLLQAYDQFREAGPNHKLIIVGEQMWSDQSPEQAYDGMKHKSDVIFTGRLSPEDLNATLASAFALTYVSYFEGFGLPIAEAFKTGTPVITGNLTSLPEVAGDAAILVDPFNVEAIAEAMQRMVSDEALRKTLVRKGSERSKLFDWQFSADGLWKSILKLK